MKTIEVFAIDRDRREAETMKQMLTATGGEEYSFSLVDETLWGLTPDKIDVLLLDYDDDPDSALALRNRFPDVAVILLSGQNREAAAREALAHGIDDYLVKERMSGELLARTIRSSLERKRLEREVSSLRRDRERLEQQVRRLESFDPVTGLPNAILFLDRLNYERERAGRQRKKMAILAVAINNLGDIKANQGIDAADLLLRESAARLRSRLRRSDTVARTEESEFGIILPDIALSHSTGDVAGGILDVLSEPFQVRTESLRIEISIGISIYPDDARDAEMLLLNARTASRGPAEPGRDQICFFDQSLDVRSREQIRLKSLLRNGIDAGEIVIFYQPVVDIITRRIVCAEALARWRHPEKGLLSPHEFIPAAEEGGLIKAIDKQVFRSVCVQFEKWLAARLGPVCVTINLSSRQVNDPALIKTLSSVLQETGLPAGSIYLEITEKTVMSDGDRTAERLKELAGIGFQLSIDDFGTGYTSVNQLKRLPVQRLKIDSMFIRRIPADPDSRTIVRSVTSLAHNMRMKTVAEGVETEDQLTFLKSVGCDEMQGYLFSRPLSADEFEKLLKGRERP